MFHLLMVIDVINSEKPIIYTCVDNGDAKIFEKLTNTDYNSSIKHH